MSRSVILQGLCLLIALAVMLGASPLRYAGPGPNVDGLAQAVDHATLADGHSHDDSDVSEAGPLPEHGLEHQDHSHVLLGLASAPASLGPRPLGELLRLRGSCRATSDPPYRLDRPPCVLSVAA
jgi:hypothetical protein